MNATGVMAAGGVGKVTAEWIVNGETEMFLWSQDVRRFAELHNNKKFLYARVKETTGISDKYFILVLFYILLINVLL